MLGTWTLRLTTPVIPRSIRELVVSPSIVLVGYCSHIKLSYSIVRKCQNNRWFYRIKWLFWTSLVDKNGHDYQFVTVIIVTITKKDITRKPRALNSKCECTSPRMLGWNLQIALLWPRRSRCFVRGRYLNRIPSRRRTLQAMDLADLDRGTNVQRNSDVGPNLYFLRILLNFTVSKLSPHLFWFVLYMQFLCPVLTVFSAPLWSTLNCTFCGKFLAAAACRRRRSDSLSFRHRRSPMLQLLFHFPIFPPYVNHASAISISASLLSHLFI